MDASKTDSGSAVMQPLLDEAAMLFVSGSKDPALCPFAGTQPTRRIWKSPTQTVVRTSPVCDQPIDVLP